MTTPSNLSFELPADQPGLAQAWTVVTVASVEELAGFGAAAFGPPSAVDWLAISAGQVGTFVGSVASPDGYFVITVVMDPTFNESGYGADQNLVYFDVDDRLYYDHVAKKMTLRIGGVPLASAVLTWAAHAALTLTIRHTPAGRSLTVVGTTTGGGTVTASASDPIGVPRTGYLMGGPDLVAQDFSLTSASAGVNLTAAEAFDGRWGNAFFDRTLFAKSTGLFTSDSLVTRPFENFEDSWDLYLKTLALAESGAFDSSTEGVENFENNWGNGPFQTALAGIGSAAFVEGGAETFAPVPGWDVTYADDLFAGTQAASFAVSADVPETFNRVRAATAVTVDLAANTIQQPGHPYANGEGVYFDSDGAPPLGLSLGIVYVVQNSASNTYKLARVDGGTTIDLQDYGTGQLRAHGDPARFWSDVI